MSRVAHGRREAYKETSGASTMLPSMAERIVRIRVRTILMIFGLAIATWALLHIVSIARQVIVWILIAVFLALAINPLVELLQRHGLHRRGIATVSRSCSSCSG